MPQAKSRLVAMYRDNGPDGTFELASSKQETDKAIKNALEDDIGAVRLELSSGDTFFLLLGQEGLFAIGVGEISQVEIARPGIITDLNNRKIQ